MARNVLVTGGAGFIGSHLVRALLDQGDSVRVLDAFLTVPRSSPPDGCELVEGDVRNADDVARACRDVEVVFHIAALRSVSRSVDDPPMTMECNVTGTTNLLHEAASAGVSRVVYASSSSVYGSAGTGPQREDDRPNPQSPYAVSKLAGEQLCRVWTEMTGIATVSLRYFNVFGPGQPADSKYATVFPAFISALLAGRAPNVEWDGEQTRDFTYITDVIDATVRAGALGSPSSLVLNVSSGAPRSINNVLRAVGDALGVHIPPVYSPRRTGDVRATHGDNRLADEVLGWTPRASWSDAVAATVGWFRSAMNDDDVEFAI